MMDTLVSLNRMHARSRWRSCYAEYKEMVQWLNENNVKYSLQYNTHANPGLPDALYMSSENALAFVLRFGL